MPKFRLHRQVYYSADLWESPPYATLLETRATWCVQMRILGFIWITIREFDYDNEETSEKFAIRLLREIEKF